MSGHKKTFYKKLDQIEERVIFWIAISLIIGFFVWQFISVGGDTGLFKHVIFTGRFWDAFWETLVGVWKYRIGPLFIVLDILFASILVFAFIKYWPIAPRVKFSQTRAPSRARAVRFRKDPAIAQHWGGILNRVKIGTQDAMKSAVLEADALVDHFLKRIGLAGEHMADRLTQILPERAPSLERVWKAHRLRNELAHTPGMTVTVTETKEALTAFRDFLVELGAL